jgi:hypothetical protein
MSTVLKTCAAAILAVVLFPAAVAPAAFAVDSAQLSAPVPAQVTNAKKVFIANPGGSSEMYLDGFGGGPDLAYVRFYNAVQAWGHYQIVASPAEADIVLAIRFETLRNGAGIVPRLQLQILDPKTGVALWALVEYPGIAVRQATADKNFDEGMARLVTDFENLGATVTTDKVGAVVASSKKK